MTFTHKLHVLAAALAFMGSTAAQTSGGTGAVRQGSGFGCASGSTWVQDGSIVRCKVPAPTTVIESACASVTNFAPIGACRFGLPASGSGVTATAPNKTPGYIGSTALTCTNGVWGPAATSCIPIPKINVTPGAPSILLGESSTFSWTTQDASAVSYNCTGANPSTGSLGLTGSRSLTGGIAGRTDCAAVATGPGGASTTASWSFYTSEPSGCAATTYSDGKCTYDIPSIASGGSAVGSNKAAGYSGKVNAACSNGRLSFAGASCAAIAPPQPAPEPSSAWPRLATYLVINCNTRGQACVTPWWTQVNVGGPFYDGALALKGQPPAYQEADGQPFLMQFGWEAPELVSRINSRWSKWEARAVRAMGVAHAICGAALPSIYRTKSTVELSGTEDGVEWRCAGTGGGLQTNPEEPSSMVISITF